jgi:hypothetical protein
VVVVMGAALQLHQLSVGSLVIYYYYITVLRSEEISMRLLRLALRSLMTPH